MTSVDAALGQLAIDASAITVAGWFASQVALRGDAIALQEGDRRLSYHALNDRVNRLAWRLLALGLNRGDRLAILAENRSEFVEVELAAARLGIITACQNWRLADTELMRAIRLVEPKLIVVSERYAQIIGRLDHGVAHVLALGQEYETALARETRLGAPPILAQAEDGLVILYTSGTTGAPKGAVISHRAMVARTLIYALDRPRYVNGAFVAWMPMFHMGSCDSIFATLLRGGKVIFVDGFKALDIAHLIGSETLGYLHLNSAVIERLVTQIKRDGIRPNSVEYVGVMADLVPPGVLAELTTLLQAPYGNTFGSTETGSVPASKGVIDVGVIPERFSKVQSSLCELRLVNENDCDVPDGESGEALVRSPSLFSGYWRAPEINAEVFRGGWYHMGDVLRRNPDRTLDFVDRRKYLIKSGGENVYPAEIENVLLTSPRIICASVVKRKDPTWGEVPVAFVVARDAQLTAADVIAICRGKIAGYKMPKDVRFLAEVDVPRSTSGKIIRHELEARLEGEKIHPTQFAS